MVGGLEESQTQIFSDCWREGGSDPSHTRSEVHGGEGVWSLICKPLSCCKCGASGDVRAVIWGVSSWPRLCVIRKSALGCTVNKVNNLIPLQPADEAAFTSPDACSREECQPSLCESKAAGPLRGQWSHFPGIA